MDKFKPTAEQVQALADFKQAYGRKWRATLEIRFYHGWPAGETGGYSGLLQQVRNSAGGIAWAFKR